MDLQNTEQTLLHTLNYYSSVAVIKKIESSC